MTHSSPMYVPAHTTQATPYPQEGPIDAPKTVVDVRAEPYGLPDTCGRQSCNIINNPTQQV